MNNTRIIILLGAGMCLISTGAIAISGFNWANSIMFLLGVVFLQTKYEE
jgi:hypothetical protein